MKTRRLMVCAVFFGALVCGSASIVLAKPGIVKTRDGRTIEGDITEKNDGVIITISGIPTTIARDNVESVQYVGSIDEQYRKRLADLPKPATAKDHIDLARWLFDNKSYDLASKETAAALQLDPNNTEATTLNTTIQGQLRLDRTKLTSGGTTPSTPVVRPTTPAKTVAPVDPTTDHTAAMRKYLSAENVLLLKQAEWSRDDTSVKISLTTDVKRKYIAAAQENAAAFNALSPSDQARRILENGTAEQRKDVHISNDPAVLAEFKRSIQPMLLSGCATAGCHGGAGGGKFFLYSSPENDAATYTNFYLLMQGSAQSEGAQRMLIDRTYPEKSLVIEFGLPSEITKVSHPEVKGVTWRPLFRSRDDAQFKTLTKWMGKLVTPDPVYGFNFSLEESAPKSPTSAPTSNPAPAPAPPK